MSCTAWDGLDQYAQNNEASRSRNWVLEQFPFYTTFILQTYFHSLYGLFTFYPELEDRMERVYRAKKMDGLLQHTVMRCYWWCLSYVPPRRPNLHSPPVTPCKCMEQQPTQLPPTECAETSSSSQTHKQNSKHSGMTFELLVCMWALVSCMCTLRKSRLVVLSRKTGKPIRLHYEIKVAVSLSTRAGVCKRYQYHMIIMRCLYTHDESAQPINQTLQTIPSFRCTWGTGNDTTALARDSLTIKQEKSSFTSPWLLMPPSPHSPDNYFPGQHFFSTAPTMLASPCVGWDHSQHSIRAPVVQLQPRMGKGPPTIFVAFGVPYPRACSAALLP